jgi:hypothetical protein
MTRIALLIAALLVASPALAQQNCIITPLRIDCGDGGSGMRIPGGGVWWGDGTSTTWDRGARKDRPQVPDARRRDRPQGSR